MRFILLKNFVILGLIISENYSFAQNNISKNIPSYPEIGKPCPYFEFDDVEYYSRKRVSLNDFRGKWLILDFWSRVCAGCIASFPKYSLLQQKFKDKAQILLIGYNSSWSNKAIRSIYSKVRQRQNVQLPVAWDTALYDKFKGNGVPYLIVIDPNGIVQGITSHIEESDFNAFFKGEHPMLPRYEMLNESPAKKYNARLPPLVNGIEANGGNDTSFRYRSIFANWNDKMPKYVFRYWKGTFTISGADLATLYKIAYLGKDTWDFTDTTLYGKYYYYPEINCKDSINFYENERTQANKYCYSLTLPFNLDAPPISDWEASNTDKKLFQKNLQECLKSIFPYSVSFVTKRKVIYRLIASSNTVSIIKTKGGESQINYSPGNGEDLKNMSMDYFAGTLLTHLIYEDPDMNQDAIIFNGTGINGNVDISLDCNMTDFDQIKKALKKYGLDIVKDSLDMKVMVISDSHTSS